MKILIINAQPDAASFSAAVATTFSEAASAAGHIVETADLVAEGFDPRERQADLDCYHGKGAVPEDVLREQRRVDQADALVLVFPVYWWSMPAVLKGWIDRVFIGGWAFKFEGGKVVGTMRDIPVLLLAVGGGNDDSYDRHGYRKAFETQIEAGIFKFCGVQRVETHLMLEVESRDGAIREAHLAKVRSLASQIA